MPEKTSLLGTITKVVFIGGAAILFALLVIFVVRLVPKAINGIANVGSSITNTISGGNLIEVTANQEEINSGEAFTLSFDYTPNVPGEYYISYSCEESLIFDIESANGPKRIICNTPFKLGENVNMISLVPALTKKNIFVDSQIRIFYRDYENRKEVAYGTEIITIKNTDGSTTSSNPFDADLAGSTVTSSPVTETTTSTKTTTGTSYTNTYYGKADLTITNIAETRGQSALSFTVYNYGTRPSGNWYFSYTDAENPGNTLYSPVQPSLAPNQGMFIQVRFDGQRYSNQLITIYVDATNIVSESNESNNVSSVVIDGDHNSNYYYNYNSRDDADLVIEDLEVGRMSGSRFVEDDEIDDNDEAAVRFTVRNRGGEDTGTWRFEITNTPYDNNDDYRSNRIGSLRPGEEREFIIEFDNIDEGTYNIRVEVDSDDDIDEEKENNNIETERLRVSN